jgi:hypothetical protein
MPAKPYISYITRPGDFRMDDPEISPNNNNNAYVEMRCVFFNPIFILYRYMLLLLLLLVHFIRIFFFGTRTLLLV